MVGRSEVAMNIEFALNVAVAVKLCAIVKSDGVAFNAAPLNRTGDSFLGQCRSILRITLSRCVAEAHWHWPIADGLSSSMPSWNV
jgi:hypothetical protein